MARGLRLNGSSPWLAVAAALALLSLAVAAITGTTSSDAWSWHADQPLRVSAWWTAALVHRGPWHLAANVGAAAAVAAWGWAAQLRAPQAAAWLVAWPLAQVLLITDPGSMSSYAGLSATLHAGVAIGCWELVRHRRGATRVVGLLVSVAVLIKLAVEMPTLQGWWQGTAAADAARQPLPGAPGHIVAGHAHACGVAAGLIVAAALDGIMRLRPRTPR